MSGGLRLLRRFSSFEIPRHWLPLTHGNLTASPNLSSPFPLPTPTRVGGGNGRRRLLIPHRKRNLSEVGFCGRALTTEDTVANPILSPYLSVRIRCSKDVSIILSEALLCFGASSASIDEVSDPKDGEIYATSIFPDGQDVHTCIWHAADSIGLNHVPSYDVSVGEQCDWIMNMQETFHPIEVTKGLWIIPEWRTPIVWLESNHLFEVYFEYFQYCPKIDKFQVY